MGPNLVGKNSEIYIGLGCNVSPANHDPPVTVFRARDRPQTVFFPRAC